MDIDASPAQGATDLHEAAHVACSQGLGSCLDHGFHIVIQHRRRDMEVFYGKSAAKSAAGLGLFHFHQPSPFDVAYQPFRFLGNSQLPHQMAGGMVGHFPLEFRLYIVNSENLYQELGELIDFTG